MGERADLSLRRPWSAARSEHGGWEVHSAPSKTGTVLDVAVYLSEEDARLLAAAPELLEALKGMQPCGDCEHRECVHAREAIARTEEASHG